MSELEQSVADYLATVAAPKPSVTGGHVCAVTLAAAAGLTAMSASLSDTLDDAEAIAAEANRLRERATMLASADTQAYRAVSTAQRLDHRVPTRSQAVADALVAAAQPPKRIARLAAEVASMAALLAAQGNPKLRGDAISAATLASGAAQGAATLARIDLASAGVGSEDAHDAQASADCAAASANAALATAGARSSVS